MLPLVWLLAACDGTTSEAPEAWAPEITCPGGPGCADAEGALRAGAAVRSIVPACFEAWIDYDGEAVKTPDEPFLDCGCDRLCPGDEGWIAPDEGEGDGVFQAAWLAGFSLSRPATDVRGPDRGMIGEGDGLEARALVLDQGATRVAIVTLDSIGTMYDEVLELRAEVASRGLDVDHVIVHSTHTHSSPDMMGIYGPSVSRTGFSEPYAHQIAVAGADAIAEAVGALTDVELRWGEVDANDYAENGVANLISDLRDPFIVDPRIGTLRFVAGDRTVATVVHFANHPETIADENTLMTADFVHGLRRTVSVGSRWLGGTTREGIGGVTLYLNGTVGGMMTSLHASVVDPEGNTWRDHTWEKVDAVGQLLGEMALDAVEADEVAPEPHLRVGAHTFTLPVANYAFQGMFLVGVFDHRSVDYDRDRTLDDDNIPTIPTEMDLLELGPLRLLTFPGEVLPESAIGGYDGSFTPPGTPIVKPDNPNPPALDQAPPGPYVWDRLGGELRWIVSLGNDEVGYIIPPYDFKLSAAEYLLEAPGDHYEETNSLGPDTLPLLEAEADRMIGWLGP
ncbi:MAG TPA: hypothetical protein PKA64_05070 [Myxococcota bacterium]|nr:hypothetical protein [Myxococcota bacterium]